MRDRAMLAMLERFGWEPLDIGRAEAVFDVTEAAARGAGASPRTAGRLGVRAAVRVLRGLDVAGEAAGAQGTGTLQPAQPRERHPAASPVEV